MHIPAAAISKVALLHCPSPTLCFERVIHLDGMEETKAVRGWMSLGLCVCNFVRKRDCKLHVGTVCVGNEDFRNWRASRRRKLIRCPGCGTYFDNDTVRKMGLRSESEIKRLGYKLNPGPMYYLDPETAVRRFALRYVRILPTGERVPFTHVRHAPQPVAKIWRPFYSEAADAALRGRAASGGPVQP